MRGYNIDDYVGQKFGNLTLIKNLNKTNKNNSKIALFKCDCGNEKEAAFTQVLHREVTSCGCMNRDKNSNLRLQSVRDKRIEFTRNHTQKNNKTGCNGVTYANGKYRARIQVNGSSIHLGYFDTFDKAVEVRKKAEKKYF
ncbi:MAG: hypothetical protein HFJ52_03955 [Clostridia bacterium]|jgi:hypothetical protein|nr:hypothetical protein [Clostridia bacterium]